jgi:hypothetical protein
MFGSAMGLIVEKIMRGPIINESTANSPDIPNASLKTQLIGSPNL